MPEDNKMNTENKDIVDIDTSGPEVDVELKEEKSEKILKTIFSPLTHLKNWMNNLMSKLKK